jgi:hypothetical protein
LDSLTFARRGPHAESGRGSKSSRKTWATQRFGAETATLREAAVAAMPHLAPLKATEGVFTAIFGSASDAAR